MINLKKKILIIDDDPDLCLLMENMVKFSGYESAKCSNPKEVLNMVKKESPDVLIMDMLLSGKDGRDITRELKEKGETNHIRILMVSAHPDAEAECLDAGADDFLSKPFDMDDFTNKVDELAKKTESGTDSQ